jgi:hypothetical protein
MIVPHKADNDAIFSKRLDAAGGVRAVGSVQRVCIGRIVA